MAGLGGWPSPRPKGQNPLWCPLWWTGRLAWWLCDLQLCSVSCLLTIPGGSQGLFGGAVRWGLRLFLIPNPLRWPLKSWRNPAFLSAERGQLTWLRRGHRCGGGGPGTGSVECCSGHRVTQWMQGSRRGRRSCKDVKVPCEWRACQLSTFCKSHHKLRDKTKTILLCSQGLWTRNSGLSDDGLSLLHGKICKNLMGVGGGGVVGSQLLTWDY